MPVRIPDWHSAQINVIPLLLPAQKMVAETEKHRNRHRNRKYCGIMLECRRIIAGNIVGDGGREMRKLRLGHALILVACSLFILLAYAGPKDFWATKPYTEWTAKEVEKILLKDSPWTNVLLLNAPSSSGSSSGGSSKGGGGGGGGGSEGPPPIYMNWYARPIREAVARQMMLNVPNTTKEQLDGILNHKSAYYEVMLYGYIPGGGGSRTAKGAPDAALTKFKEDTYLLKKNNQRLPLANIVSPPPRARNAAYFLQFAQEIDGKPTLTPEDKEVTLVIRINDNVYRYKFKFADMMVNDKLEL
jgi:hypothetical protein